MGAMKQALIAEEESPGFREAQRLRVRDANRLDMELAIYRKTLVSLYEQATRDANESPPDSVMESRSRGVAQGYRLALRQFDEIVH